ncbi:MAG: MBL fold metallo-hydrolase [Betaproteobacteria bacterium]|nr:MBL fold metallo-hydrolase [Betaproteobacteria bacterium]
MRLAVLASGSKGNAAFIEHDSTLLLLDCGLSLRSLKKRSEELGVALEDITAILISHEHTDHTNSLGIFIRRFSPVVYMTRGTALQLELAEDDFQPLRAYQPQVIGSISVLPYTLPHDAREPVQFVFAEKDGARLGFATDIGRPLARIAEILSGCNALVLECNYDPQMLEDNPNYPRSVKERISGGYGHLSNAQAGELLALIGKAGPSKLIAAHMSENNNSPQIAEAELQLQLRKIDVNPQLTLAGQSQPTGWIEINS